MSTTSPWRRSCCGRMTRSSMVTAPIWDWKSGKKSNRTPSFLPPNTESTAVRAGCPRFQQRHRLGAVHRTPQIRCALQDGTPLPNCKEHFWLPKDGLPGAAKKSQPITRALSQCESVYACQGGRFTTPRTRFLHPLGRIGNGKPQLYPPIPVNALPFAFIFLLNTPLTALFNQCFPKSVVPNGMLRACKLPHSL